MTAKNELLPLPEGNVARAALAEALRDEFHDLRKRAETSWQRGFQQGLEANRLLATQAMDALKKEREAHAETNRAMTDALLMMEGREQRDEALLRQALEALEVLRAGLLQMKENAEEYGKRWAGAYVKELRDLTTGSEEEKFDLLGILQDRLVDVASGVRKGYDAITALRERLGEKA